MRQVVWVLLLAGIFGLAGLRVQSGEQQGTFFNGKDLSGWEGLLEQFWSVKEGAIVGHSADPIKFNTFLCSKQRYTDFELQFVVDVKDDKGKSGVLSRNSGVQIRSRIHDPKKFAVTGPQCDMGGGYWGSLYGENFGGMMKASEKKVVEKALKKDGPNDYYIRCVGKRVTIKLNGETTVDEEFARLPADGIIALQLHAGGPMTITFRNIQFKDLSKK